MIVIDGIDGSGKATQTALLAKRLKKEGYSVKKIDFPRYYHNFFGNLVGRYLAGEFGDFIKTDPHVASVLYAADRFESSKEIGRWLAEGYIIVSDRYTSANQIHQGGKIKDSRKRANLIKWLEKMEYGVFKIPKPDAVLFLKMPIKIAQSLLRAKMNQKNKKYLKGKKDLAEYNIKHLRDSDAAGRKLLKSSKTWLGIQCAKRGELLAPEEISEDIFRILKRRVFT